MVLVGAYSRVIDAASSACVRIHVNLPSAITPRHVKLQLSITSTPLEITLRNLGVSKELCQDFAGGSL